VIVHDGKARLHWKLAIVEDLIKGEDDFVHAANMGNHRISCPIVKLYPLEVSNSNNEEKSQTTSSDLSKQETVDKPVFVLEEGQPQRLYSKYLKWTETLNRAREDVENN